MIIGLLDDNEYGNLAVEYFGSNNVALLDYGTKKMLYTKLLKRVSLRIPITRIRRAY